jgi:putative endopeptidase
MRCTLRFLLRLAAACALFANAPIIADAQTAPAPETHGIVIADMDRSVKPGDDFYRYANGGWLKRTEIPPDRSYMDPYGLDVDSMNDLTRKRMAGLIEEAAKANAPAGSNTRKIADLYHSFVDEAAIEAKGLAPLRPQLDAIAAIRDKHDLARALGESLRADVDDTFHTANLFGLWVAPGFNDPEHYAAYLLQGGLEMPDRDYYLSDSGSMRDIRSKYQTHISAMLSLAGFADAEDRARHVVELEHAIAEKHIPLTLIGRSSPQWTKTPAATGMVMSGSPNQILDHLSVGGTRDFDRSNNVSRIAADEHDSSWLDGHIGSRTDRDPRHPRSPARARRSSHRQPLRLSCHQSESA